MRLRDLTRRRRLHAGMLVLGAAIFVCAGLATAVAATSTSGHPVPGGSYDGHFLGKHHREAWVGVARNGRTLTDLLTVDFFCKGGSGPKHYVDQVNLPYKTRIRADGWYRRTYKQPWVEYTEDTHLVFSADGSSLKGSYHYVVTDFDANHRARRSCRVGPSKFVAELKTETTTTG